MTEQTPSRRVGLRDDIAAAIEAADYSGSMRRGDLADSVMPVLYREWPWLRAEADAGGLTDPEVRAQLHAVIKALGASETENKQLRAANTRVRTLAGRIRQGVPWTANDDHIADHIVAALDGDQAPAASCSPGAPETEPNNPAATEATDTWKEPTHPHPCTAAIEGRATPGGRRVQCTREARHPENHVGPKQDANGRVLWTDWSAGATPHEERP